MANCVPKLMEIMHKFTPQGQELLLKALKSNRAVIAEEYGFAKKLPSVLMKDGTLEKLAQQTLSKQENIFSIFDDLLASGLKIDLNSKEWREACSKYADIQREIANKPFSLIEDLRIGFEEKRKEIAKIFEKCGLKALSKWTQKAKTSEELAAHVMFGGQTLESSLQQRCIARAAESTPKRSKWVSLEALQLGNKERIEQSEILLKLQKIINPKTTNPEIAKIEEILRKEYGIEYVHISTLDEAEDILKAVKFAKKEGIQMPEAITASHLMGNPESSGENLPVAGQKNIIFLKPRRDIELMRKEFQQRTSEIENEQFIKYLEYWECINKQLGITQENLFSTTMREHVPLHELVHSEKIGKVLNTELFKKLSAKQKETAYTVSNYAAISANGMTEEVRTEIRTKQIFSKHYPDKVQQLTKEEQELLDYLS